MREKGYQLLDMATEDRLKAELRTVWSPAFRWFERVDFLESKVVVAVSGCAHGSIIKRFSLAFYRLN
jgi:hypothetical protein